MKPEEVINKIKEKAAEFARSHATEQARLLYVTGKKDAANTFLSMVRNEGVFYAVEDVAKEILKHDPDNETAKWIIENDEWKQQ
jgi:hypothetical protein